MPIYEFRCTECGHVFEELILRSSDQEDLSCPRCTARVERVLSACCVGQGGGDGGAASACVPRGGFS